MNGMVRKFLLFPLSICLLLAVFPGTVSAGSGKDLTITVNGVAFEMIYVEGTGNIKSFYIGKYEVTQAQWTAIMGSNPSSFKGDSLPVETISWNDAQKFIKKLNAVAGMQYRLPTEKEWEYAARGGSESRNYKYSGGNDVDSVAWYFSNSGNSTHPVGTKLPNELGIYDMSGNVWEWCQDFWDSGSSYHVLRGGSCFNTSDLCRSAFRDFNEPDALSNNIGFRLALDKN